MTLRDKDIAIGIATKAPSSWLSEFGKGCENFGLSHEYLDMSKNDWLNELKGINILLWRIHLSDPSGIREARLKIKIAEEMGIVCYPNTIMAQLYEDKIAQKFFFERNNVAIPDTFVSFSCRDSLEFSKLVKYPLVAKTSEGASSSGVSLLKDQRAAEKVVRTVFAEESYFSKLLRHIGYRLNSSRSFIQLWKKSFKRNSFQYVYFQEFIESDYDLRILTIGNDIASAFIRMNRPGDFRASGSGIWKSINFEDIPVEPFKIALGLSEKYDFTSMAYDFLPSPKGWLLTEISYTVLLNAVYSNNLYRFDGFALKREGAKPIGNLIVHAIVDLYKRKQGNHHVAMKR